jgi:hypothetical protein
VDIVNEKSFEVERFSGKLKKGVEGVSIFTKSNISYINQNIKIDFYFIIKNPSSELDGF